jgi:hypothetical protein
MSLSRVGGPRGSAAQLTTTPMLPAHEQLSALSGNPPDVSASWHINRRRASAWPADPAWIVVQPVTPELTVSSIGDGTSLDAPSPPHGRRHPVPAGRRRSSRIRPLVTVSTGPGRSARCRHDRTRMAGVGRTEPVMAISAVVARVRSTEGPCVGVWRSGRSRQRVAPRPLPGPTDSTVSGSGELDP